MPETSPVGSSARGTEAGSLHRLGLLAPPDVHRWGPEEHAVARYLEAPAQRVARGERVLGLGDEGGGNLYLASVSRLTQPQCDVGLVGDRAVEQLYVQSFVDSPRDRVQQLAL